MWHHQPYYARHKEKSNGEGWLFNRQEGMLIQIKPDAATQHAQFVLVSYYRLSVRLGKPVRQQSMFRHLGRRDVGQPAEDRLATMHIAQLSHHFGG